jgi:hypothetical protein
LGGLLVSANGVIIALSLGLLLQRWRLDQLLQSRRGAITDDQLDVLLRVMHAGDVPKIDTHSTDIHGLELRQTNQGTDRDSTANLQQIMLQPQDVKLITRVGAGSFGEVFRGTCFDIPCAVKLMIAVTESNANAFRAEIVLTSNLRHPNLINFIGRSAYLIASSSFNL